MEIQLYIANKLCDLSSSDLAVTLKRQFLNPEALNTKDAQKSYSITLPATPINNEIFSHVNVEEVGDKFKIYPNARLYVGGVLILDGKFRLSEIGRDSYKGNLGVPKILSAKDVFGDMMLNNAGSWKIDNFMGFDSISEYNEKANSPVIFPLALYGLLPKSAKTNGEFTAKDLYDSYVTLGLDDFLPSMSCIEMLKKVFTNSGYNLSGTALADDRLTNLYMSYKNPNEYELDWGVSKIHIAGEWRHYRNDTNEFETKYSTDSDSRRYIINLFDSTNNKLSINSDNGGNVTTRNKTSIVIPRSGLYKIQFNTNITMLDDRKVFTWSYKIGVREGYLDGATKEIHLVKNLDKTLTEINFNNRFSRENINQDIDDPKAIFPQANRVNFIDPKIDKNFICGFAFGKHGNENYRNPLNLDNCNPMAISGGRSWGFDSGNGVSDRTYSAVYSPNYQNREGVNQSQFKVDLQNANTQTWRESDKSAKGLVSQVVWLDKGDRLDLLNVTNYKYIEYYSPNTTIPEWDYSLAGYSLDYELIIEPFSHYLNWLKVDPNGNSTEAMNWNDKGTFVENQIDLMKSLPSEVKVNDWIDNFCKAFNLILYNTVGNNFNLDLKDKGTVRNTSIIIDLDKRANINQSPNQPLNLPYVYELGFTIDNSEEGYYRSITKFNEQGEPILTSGDNGGGIFETGSIDTTKLTQTSNFSYCWYKDIEYTKDGSILSLPVITDKEIWEHDYDTKEMLSKQYFDKGQRFWYKSGVKELDLGLDRAAKIALVSNTHNGDHEQTLNYRNEPNTIMSNYFLLLTNQKYYTVVECHLSPEEYSNLDIALVRFNGDLYNIAEIDGYDPLGRRKCTLKLIRKI